VTVSPKHRYIFTACTGRNGQNSLTHLLNTHCDDVHAAFEEPHATPWLPGRTGKLEQRFRRRFIQTHELLGRGRILSAFDEGRDDYIEQVVRRRLGMISRQLNRHDTSVYFDVSKYFARGLHVGFLRALPRFSVVLLVRDPILNMRSFLNRNKDFSLDNTRPDGPRNKLKLDPGDMSKGEHYLWAWCEIYLRFLDLARAPQVDKALIIRTSDLENDERMNQILDELGLSHSPVIVEPARNTNVSQGFSATEPQDADVDAFRRFLAKLPDQVRQDITYLADYEPALI